MNHVTAASCLCLSRCQESPQDSAITRDINRTFPAHDYFKDTGGDGQDSLYKICKVGHTPAGGCLKRVPKVNTGHFGTRDRQQLHAEQQSCRSHGFIQLTARQLLLAVPGSEAGVLRDAAGSCVNEVR